MKRFFIYFSLFTCFSLASLSAKAQENNPKYNAQGIVLDDYGMETDTLKEGEPAREAPLHLLLKANPSNNEGWMSSYEWLIKRKDLNGSEEETFLDRYIPEDETTVELLVSGEYSIYCYAIFYNGEDSAKYDSEYWAEHDEMKPLKVTITTSHLEFPNAFSPNGDQRNDDYGPKGMKENTTNGPKSIVEYHMSIYNRWGQRLFDTHDINNRWDGTYNGRNVKDGVYYVVCTAKGADGVKYNIKKDVNLLRGIRQKESSSSSNP